MQVTFPSGQSDCCYAETAGPRCCKCPQDTLADAQGRGHRLYNTPYVERHNLTIRMTNRRYTRKTNTFSKKLARHISMMDLWVVHYNFCRIHRTLRVTPAMEVGINDTLRDSPLARGGKAFQYCRVTLGPFMAILPVAARDKRRGKVSRLLISEGQAS